MSGGTSLDVEVSQKVPGISSLPHGKLEQLLYEAVQWQGGTISILIFFDPDNNTFLNISHSKII